MWNDTCTFFVREDLKATANFQALSKTGIGSVHSAITNEHIDQLQSHTSNLIEQNETYETALIKMAHVISTIQLNQSTAAPPPPPPPPPASKPSNEMQTILAAITNLNCPTPPVVAKPKTEMQQILALLTRTVQFGKFRCRWRWQWQLIDSIE